MVKHLVRTVIQMGLFAAFWAVGGLVTWFFLQKSAIYTVLNSTAGSMYTHVGVPSLKTVSHLTNGAQLIYETLLSRTQLRKQMTDTGDTEMALPTQVQDLSHCRLHKHAQREVY